MKYKLVCTHPFHGFEKGQEVTDPEEIAKHNEQREHHFVRVAIPEEGDPESVVPHKPLKG